MSDLSEINLEKALTFCERAEDVASTDNFDYAIEMYIEGLRLSPDALEDGHGPLRRMALIRQAKGGKKPSIKEKMKYHGGKSPLDEMLNAEFLMAKDPDNLGYAEAMLKAAVEEALWVSDPMPTDMLGLTSLTVNARGIKDITGLEYAANLTVLAKSITTRRLRKPMSLLTSRTPVAIVHPGKTLHHCRTVPCRPRSR